MLKRSDWMLYSNRETASSKRSKSIDETRPIPRWNKSLRSSENLSFARSKPREGRPSSAERVWRYSRSSNAPSSSMDGPHSIRSNVPPLPTESFRGKPQSFGSQSFGQSGKDERNATPTHFTLRHGRRYLRDVPYPLPCDLPELQRQNLQTLLATQVYGRALCSPFVQQQPPQNVLEIACGSGYWSSLCHDYFTELGCLNVSFTGLDIVPLAPDLRKQGVNWNFVQHDIRKTPLPFEDEQFDLVLLKDHSLVAQIGSQSERLLDDAIRVLGSGGVLEIWETDHTVRSLHPYPPKPPGSRPDDFDCALRTGTFLISAATPFGNSQNKFLQDSNRWIQEALDRRKLSPMPCARMQSVLLQEPDTLKDIGFRRVAIPFGETKWEREDPERWHGEVSRGKIKGDQDSILSKEQASLRATALLVVLHFIESLEPLLKEVSGKNQEEWQRWWNWMILDLYEKDGATTGDCLEVGAYWARKT